MNKQQNPTKSCWTWFSEIQDRNFQLFKIKPGLKQTLECKIEFEALEIGKLEIFLLDFEKTEN